MGASLCRYLKWFVALAGIWTFFFSSDAQIQLAYTVEVEPNDTFGSAQVLSPALSSTQGIVVWQATLQPQRDVDIYRVQVAAAGVYSFRVDTGRDTVLAIYDATGSELARNNDGGNPDVPNNLASGLSLFLEPGTYFVKVWYFLDLGQCRYALRMFPNTQAPDHDPTEPNDTPENAIPLGSFIGGELITFDPRFLIYGGGDVDVYWFKVSSPASFLRIRTETYVDTVIRVLTPSGTLLENDDSDWDILNGGASEVVIPTAEAGIYYVFVRGFGTWGGYYRLRILADLPTEITLTDGNTVFRIRDLRGSEFRNPTNNIDWWVAGRDHAYQMGWWYRRRGRDSRELTLGNLVTVDQVAPNRVFLTYQEGEVLFDVHYELLSRDPDSALLRADLVALNFSSTALPLNLYHYFDLDVGGAPSNRADGTPNELLLQGGDFMCKVMPLFIPDFWEITPFSQTIDLLTDANPDDLRNGTLPLVADITGAYQQVLTIPPFEFHQVRILYGLNVPFLSPADVNLDGCVDDSDLLAVLFAFGSQGFLLSEDVNSDGAVDDSDLLAVLFAFGRGC